MRDGLAAMLGAQPDIRVTAALGNGDALVHARRVAADVVLLDLSLGNRNSLQLVRSILRTEPAPQIIVMDLAPLQPSLAAYVQAGVAGFVLKDATFVEFLHTIREVARGTRVLPTSLTSSLLTQIAELATRSGAGNPYTAVKMTKREREVVELIAEGLSNKQIALRLHLAVDTVKSHVHNILEKLALHTRLEIARYRHLGGPFPENE